MSASDAGAGGLCAAATVAQLSVTAVKGTRLRTVERVLLRSSGVLEDRRFFIIDARNRMVNAKSLGALQTIVADYDHEERRLTLRFPGAGDAGAVSARVELGPAAQVRFYSRSREGRLVEGPFAEALSRHLGQPVRLFEAAPQGSGVDRGAAGGVSLVSSGSLRRLAAEGGLDSLDARRFRMLVEVDGLQAHAEDGWVGRVVRIGRARVRVKGHVGRCLITSRDPESGEVDLPTLDLLRGYRGDVESTEPLPFGVYGQVVSPGQVCVGDRVTVE